MEYEIGALIAMDQWMVIMKEEIKENTHAYIKHTYNTL